MAVQLGYSAAASVSDVVAEARHQVEGIVADAPSGRQPLETSSS